MGTVLGGGTYSTIGSAKPGELVLWSDDRARAIGIVQEGETHNGDPMLATFESTYGMPRFLRVAPETRCISFGSDWVLEPVDTVGAHPSHFEVARRAGLLVFASGGWFINLVTSPPNSIGHFGWHWFALADQRIQQSLERGAVYDQWRLWTSDSDRDHPRGVPLLAYKAEPFSVQR
jgi:hypothetical protein